MDLTLIAAVGLAVMPHAISGETASSVGTSYCAPSCSGTPCGYVVARTAPVYQTPCGPGYGHSTVYNYGVYPVQAPGKRNIAAAAANYGKTLEK